MLEEIKKILISQKTEELNRREKINSEIQKINEDQRHKDFNEIDRKLNNIESEILTLSRNPFSRIFSGKKIKTLYDEYKKIAESKMDILNVFNEKREKLITELSKLVHDSGNIELEIRHIEEAQSLQELGITEEEAQKILRKYHQHNENSVIQKVLSKVKLRKPITREEIFKIMQELFQTNSSAFVIELQSLNPNKFASDLIEIGIVIDKDKMEFLNELYNYLNTPNLSVPSIETIQITDKLDNYYCNEIKKVLSGLKEFQSQSSIAFPQVMALSAIISMAKEHKKETEIHK